MKPGINILLLLVLVHGVSFSQGIRDSVFHIQGVQVTADRVFTKEEAGMKKTRVDSLVMLDKVHLSVSSILSENTTVIMKEYGRGALATASFRGTAPTHTQVSWNGININSPMLGMVDFSLIPVYIVDDMTLQHGAASVSHSSGGLGGHISLNNTVDWRNKISGRYIQGMGSFSTFDEFAQFNIGNKTIQSKTRVYHNYSKNNYLLVNKNLEETDPETGEDYYPIQRNKNAAFFKYGAQQELYFKHSPAMYSSVQLWHQQAERAIPNVLSYEGSDTLTSRSNRQKDHTFKGVANFRYYKDKWKAKLTSGFDYQQLDYVMKVNSNGGETYTPVNSGSKMKSWHNNANFRYDVSDKISTVFKIDANLFDITTFDTTSRRGYKEKRGEYSAFGGIYMEATRKINTSLEFRKDVVPGVTCPFIYNLGISYKPFLTRDLVLKGSFARNFHNPTINDLYWQPGGNPDLLPEKGYTGEYGVRYRLAHHRFKADHELTVYHSEINQWILWLPSIKGYWEAMNIDKVKSDGIEYSLKCSYNLKNWDFIANSTYTYTKTLNYGEPLNENDLSRGSQLPFIPLHSANALLSVKYRNASLNYQYHFYGVRHLLSSNKVSPDNEHPFFRLYAQHLNHLSVGYNVEFSKELEMEAVFKINNLLDEVYRSVLNRVMPRQNYTLLVMIKFN